MNKKNSRVSVWSKVLWTLFFIFLSLHVAIWITGYTYIYKTLIYTYPGIDDLDIFHSRIISSETSKDWEIGEEYNRKELPPATLQTLDQLETVAFLVIQDDSIRYEKYWATHNENSVINSFSVAKSVVGILTGIAADENKISLDDPVGKYLKHFSEGENEKLRIKHLLTMTSGLNWDESYSALFSKTTEAYYGSDLKKLVEELKVIREPGTLFEYMSCNTLLLGMILEVATGMKLSDYASEKLWNPMSAVHPAFWSLDRNDGIEKSYCCFYSTARDFARFGKLMLNKGQWNGKRIISENYVNESLMPVQVPDAGGSEVNYYGYQWWLLDHRNEKIFYARGILGQYIIVIPDKKIIIVRLGNKRGERTPDNHYTDLISYVDGVLVSFAEGQMTTSMH